MSLAPYVVMTIKSKIVALGALGAAAYGVARAMRRRDVTSDLDMRFDSSDLDDPVILTEEVFVITEPRQAEPAS
jgi:hypothetical protein